VVVKAECSSFGVTAAAVDDDDASLVLCLLLGCPEEDFAGKNKRIPWKT